MTIKDLYNKKIKLIEDGNLYQRDESKLISLFDSKEEYYTYRQNLCTFLKECIYDLLTDEVKLSEDYELPDELKKEPFDDVFDDVLNNNENELLFEERKYVIMRSGDNDEFWFISMYIN